MKTIDGIEPRPALFEREASRGDAASQLLLLPLLLAAVISLGTTVASIGYRLSAPFPLDPWESMYVIEGYRAVNGQPLYENWKSGHATHLYGPLSTYAVAAIYYFTGPRLQAARWIALISSIITGIAFILAFVERRTWVYLIIGLALFMSLHLRSLALFTDARPDALAFLIATLGLMASYRAQRIGSVAWQALAAALMVVSFLFKQTYAVAVLVPPLAVLLLGGLSRRDLLRSMLPMVAMLTTGLVLKFGFPVAWYYSVRVPRLYAIDLWRLLVATENLFMFNPLFMVVAAIVLAGAGGGIRQDRKSVWLLAASAIGSLMGVLALAKRGGNYNSMMLAYAPLTAFCMLRLPLAVDRLAQVPMSASLRCGAGVALGLMLLTTSFGQLRTNFAPVFTSSNNSDSYAAAIELARSLEGRVACPDEPTITFFARGQVERSLEAFLWVTAFTEEVEPWLVSNTRNVKWIITASTPEYPSRTSPLLSDLGFRKVQTPMLDSTYGLWRRAVPTTTSDEP